MSIEITPALQAAFSVCSPYVAATADEAADYERAVSDIAFVAALPVAVARDRFRAFTACQPNTWRDCLAWFKAGDQEVWDALQGERK